MAQIPPALHPLLGGDVAAVTEAQLQRLIGHEEGQTLEFKRELGPQKENREFAVDVTALANGGGGLLLVGIDEDRASGRATSVDGVPVVEGGLAARVELILDGLVRPHLPVSVGRVDLTDGNEVILVAVEGGPRRPHAVLDGESKLIYPIRRGRKKGYLAETEVADAYARRFTSADSRAQDLADLHNSMATGLDASLLAWTVVSLLPSNPGGAPGRPQAADETRTWANNLPWVKGRSAWHARIGHRSVLLTDEIERTATQNAVLRYDGAGSVAWGTLTRWLGNKGQLGFPQIAGEPQRLVHPAPQFLEMVLESLFMLGGHARRTGATGSADLAVQIVTADDCLTIVLGAGQQQHYIGLPETIEVKGSSQVSRATVELDLIGEDAMGALAVAATLTRDLVSEYGRATLGVFDADGRLDPRLAQAYAATLANWARDEGLIPRS
jgi:hypothetical protein